MNVTLLAPGPVRTEDPDPAEASIVDKLVPDFLWISSEYTAKAVAGRAGATTRCASCPASSARRCPLAGQYSPRAVVAPIVGTFYRNWAARGQVSRILCRKLWKHIAFTR